MTDNALALDTPRTSPRINRGDIVLLVAYFILRILVTNLLGLNPDRTHFQFVCLYVAYYLIIAALIWRNRRDLSAFHIDRGSLILFILFGSLFRVRSLDSLGTMIVEAFLFLFIVGFSIVLLNEKIQLGSLPHFRKWVGIAILSGFVRLPLQMLLDPHFFEYAKNFSFPFMAVVFMNTFFAEMGSAAIIEEPIYRGFLWSTLRKLNWSEPKILLFQAFLFWISHPYMVTRPASFWVLLPVVSLILGYLVMKSKSILPSMIAHAAYNAAVAALMPSR